MLVKWIVKCARYRFCFPILAELHRDSGCKFITLVRRLNASDRAVRQALDYLIEVGMVERNPGYGHPSRPEYLVSQTCTDEAAWALRVWDELKKWDQEEVGRQRWSLATVAAIAGGADRFAEIQRVLGKVSPKALSSVLKQLQDAGLASRHLVDGNPPVALYRPTPWANELLGTSPIRD